MENIDYQKKTNELVSDLLEKDNKLFFGKIKNGLDKLVIFRRNCKIPVTMDLLFLAMTNANFLKNSIFDLAKSQDIYSSAVLYRALIELFIRSYYISIHFTQSRDDTFAKDFKMISEASEIFNSFKVLNKQNEYLGKSKTNFDVYEEIQSKFSLFQGKSKSKIKFKLQSHSFNNMLLTVAQKINKDGYQDSILKGLISDYSILSSFVHGGDFSQLHTIANSFDDTRFLEIKKTLEMSLFFATSIKIQIFLTASLIDPSFLEYVKILREYIIEN